MTLTAEPIAATASAPRLYRLGDLLTDWQTDANAAETARIEGRPRGPITGLKTLDRELGGALESGIHVLHGMPGSGKTALGLQVACRAGCPALIVTCEMAPLELLRRIVARETGTFLGRLRDHEMGPAASLALAQRGIAAAPDVAILDATRDFVAADKLEEVAAVVKADREHILIVIDSAHSWAAGIANVPEYDRLNAALDALRRIASELDCPILTTAERNRASMGTGGLNASAGTRRFEYGGESVWDLAAEGEPDATGEKTVKLTLQKNRNGTAGKSLSLRFHGALQRFTEG